MIRCELIYPHADIKISNLQLSGILPFLVKSISITIALISNCIAEYKLIKAHTGSCRAGFDHQI